MTASRRRIATVRGVGRPSRSPRELEEGWGSVIFGIDALSVDPGLSGAGEIYLRELITHLTLVDPENEYRVFTHAARPEWADGAAPNRRIIAAPRTGPGALPPLFAEQVWLPLAARRAGVHALLCSTAAIPVLLSQPAVVSLQRLWTSHPEFWAAKRSLLHRWRLRLRDSRDHWGIRHSVRRAAAVLAVSDQARRDAILFCGADPSRIAVAPHGVSDQFRPVDAPQRI